MDLFSDVFLLQTSTFFCPLDNFLWKNQCTHILATLLFIPLMVFSVQSYARGFIATLYTSHVRLLLLNIHKHQSLLW